MAVSRLHTVRLTILAAFVVLATPAFSIELFRYRGAAKDGGTLEYVGITLVGFILTSLNDLILALVANLKRQLARKYA